MKFEFLDNFTFSCLNSSSKEKAAPLDSVVQQMKINNKPIWKSEASEKYAILL
jgi:hypothetical protein